MIYILLGWAQKKRLPFPIPTKGGDFNSKMVQMVPPLAMPVNFAPRRFRKFLATEFPLEKVEKWPDHSQEVTKKEVSIYGDGAPFQMGPFMANL